MQELQDLIKALRDRPEIQKLAEDRARKYVAAYAKAGDFEASWDDLPHSNKEWGVEAQLSLLLDPEDRQARATLRAWAMGEDRRWGHAVQCPDGRHYASGGQFLVPARRTYWALKEERALSLYADILQVLEARE